MNTVHFGQINIRLPQGADPQEAARDLHEKTRARVFHAPAAREAGDNTLTMLTSLEERGDYGQARSLMNKYGDTRPHLEEAFVNYQNRLYENADVTVDYEA